MFRLSNLARKQSSLLASLRPTKKPPFGGFLYERAVVDVARTAALEPDSEIAKSLKRIHELVDKYKNDDPILNQDVA